MELYGSLHNISGSVTASVFTGSFIGDGSGLAGIQASGVTGLNLSQIANGDATASISTSGFTVNKNTQIRGNLAVTGSIIANEYIVSSSVIYMTTSFASGSTAFGDDLIDTHKFTGSVQITGSISLNGQAIGTGKLDETTFQSYTSSNNGRVSSLETSSGSLNSFTSSINTTIKSKLDSDSVISGSVQVNITGTTGYSTFSSSVDNLSSSIATTTLNLKNRVDSIETSTSSLNSFTSSINTTIKSKLNNDSVISGSVQVNITDTTGYSTFSSSISSSIGSLSSSVATTTSGISSTVTSLSSSIATTTSELSSSVATTTSNIQSRATSIESKTGSYATTGSNVFQGDQTITGSLYVSQNLIIAGSSSIQNISSSVLNIADNIITVNAVNPSVRFGGLAVIDSGSSPQVSGSILFDSVNNQWLFVYQNQGTVTSSVLLMGPETYNNIGNETYITSNRIVKSTGIEHLTNSNISDDGTTVTILSNAIVNGTFRATGTTLVSGSLQIDHNTTTNYVANQHIDHTTVSISAGDGLSGGGTIASTRTLTLDTGSVHFLDGVKKELNTEGIVSGSSQISFTGISNRPALVSGSAQISFNGITDKPTLVSGSAQISFGSISGVPSGLVSGSSQITLTSGQVTTGLGFTPYNATNPSGYITGINSSAVTTALGYTPYNSTNPSGYISGISFANVSSKPTTLSGYGITDALPLAGGTMTGTITITNTDIRSNASSNWTGDPGTQGKIQYHSNRWYIVSDSSSDRIVQFRRNGSDVSHIANDGTFNGNITGNAATAGGFTPSQTSGAASRIVVADGNGYIINNYFNASGGGSERNASGMGYFAGHNTSDYYYRSYTAAAAAALLSGQAMNISGNATTASSTGTLSSNAVTNGYLVIGGNYSSNAYNAIAGGTRLMFGGGDADAQGNYYIGTNMEDYGGNYNKLDLRWHTGIRMGAQAGYGGIRFYNNEDLSSVLFSIGASDGNVRSHTNLLPSANNSYNLGNASLRWANLYTNDLHLSNEGKEGGNEIDGTTGDWTIQEGEENLYIINHKNGKKFKIDLTEIV
jgi:trimeric autotransporter adhesin